MKPCESEKGRTRLSADARKTQEARRSLPTALAGSASKQRLNASYKPHNVGRTALCAAWVFFVVCTIGAAQTQPPPKTPPGAATANPQPTPVSPRTEAGDESTSPDWAPELFYGIWNSPNPDASEELYRAAFAAGPDVIPQLEAALRDDRTAEFAAQSLAYIGGNRALEILNALSNDPRELGLKRFFYGALAEVSTPEATQVLFDAIANAAHQPDRTITESAILALTVRADAALIPRLRDLEAKADDPVIRDDLENAGDVIAARVKYFSTAEGANPEFSLERAVRTYFVPALEPAPPAPAKAAPRAAKPGAARPAAQPEAPANVRVDQVTLSPDKMRALASVTFTVPSAVAHYTMVLAKRGGNWQLASVWLGSEEETPGQN